MRTILATLLLCVLWAPAHAEESGIASNYGYRDGYHGKKTANGERFNTYASPDRLTCAHKTLPFGRVVEVRNTQNDRRITCRINDRGPFVAGRIIDVMPVVARALGFDGLAPVRIERAL